MAKTPSNKGDYSEKEALERMNKALKGAMTEPPKPHKEMAKGRRNGRKEGRK